MERKIVVSLCVLTMLASSFCAGEILIANFEEDGLDYGWWTGGLTSTIVSGTGNTLDENAIELVNTEGGWGDNLEFALLGTSAQALLISSGKVTADITAFSADFPLGYSSVGLLVNTGLGEEGDWASTYWGVFDWQDIVFDATTTMEFEVTDQEALDALANATGWANIGLLFYVDDNPEDEITGEYVYASMATYYVDNVRVVPEPATMALLGFGGLAALIRRKR